MELLSACQNQRCQIHDQESGQKLDLTVPNGWACQAYRFDEQRDFWPGDRSPDGLLLIRRPNGEVLVCFVELKSGKKKDWKYFREQLEMGVSHFAPLQHHPFEELEKGQQKKRRGIASHGDKHHDRWRNQKDALPFDIPKTHRVICLVVGTRSSGRSPYFNPAKPVMVCGKRVRFAFVEVSKESLPVDELLRKAAV